LGGRVLQRKLDKKMMKNEEEKNKDRETGADQPVSQDPEHSALYRKDPETGLWIVVNPAGSLGYNYLYRDE